MTFTTCIEGQRAAYLNQLAEEWTHEPYSRPASVAASLADAPRAPLTHSICDAIAPLESYAYANPERRQAVESASILMRRQAF